MDYRDFRFATLALLAIGASSCDSADSPLVAPERIAEPTRFNVEAGEFGDVHNATLAAALAELKTVADTLGPLSETEALTFSRPTAEDHLDSEGFTPSSESWGMGIEDVELGEEVVEEHGYGGSLLLDPCLTQLGYCAARGLLDSLLAVIAGGPMPLNDLESEFQDLEALAQDSLHGTLYEDGFAAVMSIARSSAEYWLDSQTQVAWNAVLEDGGGMSVVIGSSAATDCGWKTLLGDVAGATGGFLRSFGNWVWAGIGGALGSTAAYTLCKADEALG